MAFIPNAWALIFIDPKYNLYVVPNHRWPNIRGSVAVFESRPAFTAFSVV